MPDDHSHDGKSLTRTEVPARAMKAVVSDVVTLDPYHLERMAKAAISMDRSSCDRAFEAALDDGIAPEVIADHYIPAIARDMGEAWCADEMNFATVTIGASRLQAKLRDLGPAWSGDLAGAVDAPTILLVVAHEIYHTLGAMVLAGQLRRKGMSVRLMLGATPGDVVARMIHSGYDAVFISASCGETLESLARIVKSVRQNKSSPPPIVLGGTILTTAPDARALTGADFATNDPDEALRLCELNGKRDLMSTDRRSHQMARRQTP